MPRAKGDKKERLTSYTEKELGIRLGSKGGAFSFVLCFPGGYSLGMANLGFQTLLYTAYRVPEWRVERAFPETLPRSLEKGIPLTNFNLVGFSVPFETDLLKAIEMLQASGIPLFFRERTDRDPWVVFGGVAASLNPEIFAPFADFLIVGEAEEVFPRVLESLGNSFSNSEDRKETKLRLAQLPGVYVPELVEPVYKGDFIVDFSLKNGVSSLPVVAQRTDVDAFGTHSFIYAPCGYFKNTFLVEISRGCKYACKFCAVSKVYAPVRYRNLDRIKQSFEYGLQFTHKIGLVGSDILGHPQIEEILSFLLQKKARVTTSSLSALMLYKKKELLTLLASLQHETITLAPECGDEEGRRFLGKNLKDQEWLDLIRELLEKKFKVKLYFLLGHPVLSPQKHLDFLRTIIGVTGRKELLSVSYSFLVPKPHTPFEDLEIPDLEKWLEEGEAFQKGLQQLKINFAGESPRLSLVQLILSRGDRKLAEKLPQLLNYSHPFSLGHWRDLLKELQRDIREWARNPWKEGFKPWQTVTFSFPQSTSGILTPGFCVNPTGDGGEPA